MTLADIVAGHATQPKGIPRIIVADDSEAMRDMYNLLLGLPGRKKGIDVQIVSDGQELVDAVNTHYNGIGYDKAGIVVTDYEMPGLNGLEAIENIRKTNPDIPIILVTANLLNDKEKAVLERCQPADYLLKPVKRDSLYAAIDAAAQKYQLGLPHLNGAPAPGK